MIFEPQAEPRLRYDVEREGDGWRAVLVTGIDTGETWSGPEAQALWAQKRANDAVALAAAAVLRVVMPEVEERRLDVGGMVVFGLPVEFADEVGPPLAYDMAGACLDALADGVLAVVWSA